MLAEFQRLPALSNLHVTSLTQDFLAPKHSLIGIRLQNPLSEATLTEYLEKLFGIGIHLRTLLYVPYTP